MSTDRALQRLDQIERTSLHISPVDTGKWRVTKVNSPANSQTIAPADLRWLLDIAREYFSAERTTDA